MPLSVESRLALDFAAEESKALQQDVIDSGHLVLGLLRMEKCIAAVLLRQHGVDLTTYRNLMQGKGLGIRAVDRPNPWAEPESDNSASLGNAIARLAEVVRRMVGNLDTYSEAYGDQRLKRKPWSRKEALGHLIDWGVTYQHWLARALTEPKLIVTEYPQEESLLRRSWLAFKNRRRFQLRHAL